MAKKQGTFSILDRSLLARLPLMDTDQAGQWMDGAITAVVHGQKGGACDSATSGRWSLARVRCSAGSGPS
jgi:hypothetical protein